MLLTYSKWGRTIVLYSGRNISLGTDHLTCRKLLGIWKNRTSFLNRNWLKLYHVRHDASHRRYVQWSILIYFRSFCSWFIRFSIHDYNKWNVTDAGFYMIRNGACSNIPCNGEMSRKNKVLISRIYLASSDCQSRSVPASNITILYCMWTFSGCESLLK